MGNVPSPFVVGLALMLVLPPAGGALARTWRLVDARTHAEITSWGKDCGPRPTDTAPPTGFDYPEAADGSLTPGARAPRIFDASICTYLTQQRDLRVTRTDAGWRCETPPGAPKQVTGTVTRAPRDAGLRISHRVRYAWVLEGSQCDVELTGRYDLDDPNATVAAPADTPPDCSRPGAPNRLELVGSARRVVPADGRIGLAVRALDAQGCEVGGMPTWSATEGHVDAEGRFDARGVAPGASITVTAARDALAARFTLRVATDAADFAALTVADPQLTLGALASLPPQRGEALSGAAQGEDAAAAARRARILMAAFVSLLVLATLVGLWISLRALRRRRDRTAEVLDANALDVLARSAAARAARTAAGTTAPPGRPPPGEAGSICPVCGQQYPPEAEFCGQDGSRLQRLN